ncbi:hypothetical protein D1O30_11320 [Methylocystis hirsuta]|uniref:Uncharacterized protein n=1 Tax=Methylocystis hirsuta TaxID=369798 RepID=A0A3M9XP64_9HYPH|nr:hypothetical protein D1O30_11320 [Methylocystis hirsuta]
MGALAGAVDEWVIGGAPTEEKAGGRQGARRSPGSDCAPGARLSNPRRCGAWATGSKILGVSADFVGDRFRVYCAISLRASSRTHAYFSFSDNGFANSRGDGARIHRHSLVYKN